MWSTAAERAFQESELAAAARTDLARLFDRLLAENALRFNIASSLLHTSLTQIKEAINGGKSA